MESTIKPTIPKVSPEVVIKDLEKRGYDIATNKQSNMNDMMNHMREGMKEFKEKTGKPMTYAEMRAAWG